MMTEIIRTPFCQFKLIIFGYIVTVTSNLSTSTIFMKLNENLKTLILTVNYDNIIKLNEQNIVLFGGFL